MSAAPATVEGGLRLAPLLLANLACTMAMMAFVALLGPLSRLLGLEPWHAGVAATSSGVFWMLMARPWGQASDRFGRRRVLLAGVAGFALAYGALCLFLHWALGAAPAPWIAFVGLVAGRAMMGGFYAAVPPTTAALVADHLEPARRAAALATVGAAGAVGMVAGPALAGLLATGGLTLPLLVTFLMPVLAVLALWRGVPAGVPANTAGPLPAWMDARLRRPMAAAFAAMCCVAIAQLTVGFYAMDRLGMDETAAAGTAGIALTVVGVALILSQMLVGRVALAPERLIAIGAAVAALGYGVAAFSATAVQLWLGYLIAAAGMGWVFPGFAAMASNAVSPREQGAAAGSVAAAQGLGMVLGPLLGSLAYALWPSLAYLLGAALLLPVAAWCGSAARTAEPARR